MTATTIEATEDGPLKINGPVSLTDASGGQYEVDADGSTYLCRCGLSSNKPFCDGTHAKQGFEADERAPDRSGADQEGPA